MNGIPSNFNDVVKGLVGPDGKPIGTTKTMAGPMAGVQWAVAFVMLRDEEGVETVGMCHLEPEDCVVIDTQMGDDENDFVQNVQFTVRPGAQQFMAPWEGVPATMTDLILARRDFENYVANARATQAEAPSGPDEPEGPQVG